MKIYKLIPTHNILTSFSTREAADLVELIEIAESDVTLRDRFPPARRKRFSQIKRGLIKIAQTTKRSK